jgi:O-antigen/teichoic acid export membrane protein
VFNFTGFQFKPKLNTWQFLKESLPILYSSSIIVILNWLGTFVLGIYSTNEVIGIFSLCVKIAFLLNFVSQAINSILAPKIAKIYMSNKLLECQKLISFSAKLNFLSSLIIGIIVIIFNKYLLGIFGEEFKAGSLIFIILCIGQLISSFSGSVGIILQMTGKQVIYQYLMIIALIVSLFFMFLLVPIYGGEGAAIASLLSMLSWNLLGIIYIEKKLFIKSYFTLNTLKRDV